MSNRTGTPQRERVERGIWRRRNAAGAWVYDISWKDGQGKDRMKAVPGGIRAARAARAEAQAAAARGERPPSTLNFRDGAEDWFETGKGRWKLHTAATNRAHLDNHLLPAFGDRKMAGITANDIAKFVSAKRGVLKGWTVKGQLGVLSGTFNHAIRHLGLHDKANPVTLLERYERPTTEDQRDHRVLHPDELERLLGAIDDDHRLIFRLAAETGARLGEALGLIWSDLDLDRHAITIKYQLSRQTKQRTYLKKPRSRRTIEISPGLATKLAQARLRAPANQSSDHDFVFLSPCWHTL